MRHLTLLLAAAFLIGPAHAQDVADCLTVQGAAPAFYDTLACEDLCSYDAASKTMTCDGSDSVCELGYGSDLDITAVNYQGDRVSAFGSCAQSIGTQHFCCTLSAPGDVLREVVLVGTSHHDTRLSFQTATRSLGEHPQAGRVRIGRIEGAGGDDAIWGSNTDHARYEDELHGGTGGDTIRGGEGDDLLSGENGEDTLIGGPGNDTLWGGGHSDTLSGEEGVDLLRGGAGHDWLYGGPDTDFLYGTWNNDHLYGQGGDDHLYGENGVDFLDGGEGNDRLYGGNHNDTLEGGEDNDVLRGGSGRDTLRGDEGADTLYGESGDDRLEGGPDDDFLFGGDQRDHLFGDLGSDVLSGQDGDDFLDGGYGDDVLSGGDGMDDLYGGNDNDVLLGGLGEDDLYGGWDDDVLCDTEEEIPNVNAMYGGTPGITYPIMDRHDSFDRAWLGPRADGSYNVIQLGYNDVEEVTNGWYSQNVRAPGGAIRLGTSPYPECTDAMIW